MPPTDPPKGRYPLGMVGWWWCGDCRRVVPVAVMAVNDSDAVDI